MEDKYFKNLGSISGYDNYEKYSNEMYTNNTTKEDSFIKNNDNQLLQNKEIKSILDSKFYLIKKIKLEKLHIQLHKYNLLFHLQIKHYYHHYN